MIAVDLIEIKQLKVFSTIGVYDWEQQIKQALLLDIEVACDICEIAKTDDLEQTFDYAQMSQAICDFLQAQPFKLIETLAQSVADFLHRTFKITNIRLRVTKPNAIANAKTVSVLIERQY